MEIRYIAALASMLIMCNAHASCNYKDAQEKLMQSNNMLQTYKSEQMGLIAKGSEPPTELNKKIETIAQVIADNGIALSKIGDPLKITYETKVPDAICNEYERIISTYAPQDYKKSEIVHSADTPFKCKGVSDTDLWMRYAEIIKIQPGLIRQGKITTAQAAEMSTMMGEFGVKMTTDFPAACAILVQVEDKIKGYQ